MRWSFLFFSHLLCSLWSSVNNFYWHIFKFTEYFLGFMKPTDESIDGIPDLCYYEFYFSYSHFILYYNFISLLKFPTFHACCPLPDRFFDRVIISILNSLSHSSNIMFISESGCLVVWIALSFNTVLFLSRFFVWLLLFGGMLNICYKIVETEVVDMSIYLSRSLL